ncbi:diacylglycerol kinase [Moritella sp. Urea-trap-13]|uniref:diacylglycerol kinase n=1 Tax=Moritella sp. Urea-trap-13 TaxID=2058327 RepID=UPI000C342109|nr:diacylglycerol kinase [Moritella sp. Urea-trap-13]PKH05037.1 diacylglycerol kinase [Moritella sp. Urea-trap-13]
MKPGKTGLVRLIHALRYSWLGVKAAWRCESAFRQEIVLLLLLTPVALLLPLPGIEKLLLIISLLAVIVVELLNSSIEAVVDRIGTEIHPLSGQAKDMGSAAVLFTCLIALLTWSYVLFNYFF